MLLKPVAPFHQFSSWQWRHSELVAILSGLCATLQGLTGHRQHLFPGRDNPPGPMTSHSLRQLLKSLGWSGTYSSPTTRTTDSTRLNEMGYRPDAIEAQLAHADSNNVRRTYNHTAYLDERKAMMQNWADKLDGWVSSTDSIADVS